MYEPIKPEVRFWSKVEVGSWNKCWKWRGNVAGRYGQFALTHTTMVVASRYAWEYFNGTIPDSVLVCHKCDEPKCVNPRHLFLGTALDNNHDMITKGRNKHVTIFKELCIRGHDMLKTRRRKPCGDTYCVECSNLYYQERVKNVNNHKEQKIQSQTSPESSPG